MSPPIPAVLLMIYRRPDTTARVLQAIRQARPSLLFVAADGPRPGRDGEREECEATRRVVDEGIDWPCRVERLYRKENVGVRLAIPEAITWFLDQVGEGIILEDDTLPSLDFFTYCGELLERYRQDERVWVVGGSNGIGPDCFEGASYAFTYYNPIWGWATWRRAWTFFDPVCADVDKEADPARLEEILKSAEAARYWSEIFHQSARGEIDAYDYFWRFTLWKSQALSCIPSVNLITNIGDAARAAHPGGANDSMVHRKREPLGFPLIHPEIVADNGRVTARKLEHRMKRANEAAGSTTLQPRLSFFSRMSGWFREPFAKGPSV